MLFELIRIYWMCVLSHFSHVWLFVTVARQAPTPWDSSGKNTGEDCHSPLQRIFLTHGSNLGLLHCRQILYHLSYREVQYIHYCEHWVEFPVLYSRQGILPNTLVINIVLCIHMANSLWCTAETNTTFVKWLNLN